MWSAVTSGVLTLALAMGIGRFAYTAILPAMRVETGLDIAASGWLASINYLGYFVGALGVSWVPKGRARTNVFRLALAASALSTLAMGLTESFPLWAAARLISGLASAGAFILGVALALDRLAHLGAEHRAGWLYAGVGGGIAGSGLFIALSEATLGHAASWIVLGLIASLFAVLPWLTLTDHTPIAHQGAAGGSRAGTAVPARNGTDWAPLLLLTFAYFLEGGGYIVTGTFLPAIMADQPATAHWAGWAWMVAGVAAIPSAILWVAISRRAGLWGALILAHLLQAAGIALPTIPAVWAGMTSAVTFGLTFVGIVGLSFALGRRLSGGASNKIIGLLTAAYGLGQILGPLAAAALAGDGERYDLALYAAAGVVVVAAAALAVGSRLEGRA